MKTFLKLNFVILFSLVFSLAAFAQSNAKIEQELVDALKEVQKYSNYGGNSDDDKLSKANDIFEGKLLKYTKVSSTLSYKFAALGELLYISTSDDGKLRVYSWDMEDGGTMHDYASVYQYQGSDGKVYSQTDQVAGKEDGGAGSFVTDVFTADAKGVKIYIVCSTFIGSTMDHSQSANLFQIKGAALDKNVKLIKTKSGLTSTLGFEYNFFSVVDRNERPVRLILYDKKNKRLTIPVVIADKEFPNGKVTDKFINYQFDGTYFVKVN